VTNTAESSKQDTLYQEATHDYGSALDRLTRAYEANPEKRHDLLQEIQLALWSSLASFNGRCSMRTWVYRVAHNVATSHAHSSSCVRIFISGSAQVNALPVLCT
jgi:RNA polymerase sigma-70 factor, ECF subfamily